MYRHTRMETCIQTHVQTHMYRHTYRHTCADTRTDTHVQIHIHSFTLGAFTVASGYRFPRLNKISDPIRSNPCTDTHVQTHTYRHTCTDTHVQTHTYRHTCTDTLVQVHSHSCVHPYKHLQLRICIVLCRAIQHRWLGWYW